MANPVRQMLARNSQCCPVFHKPNIINIGNLGAAHTLIDPAHHVTQNTLSIIVELALYGVVTHAFGTF